ncbi:MAG: hypothetical protein Ct9H300mP28_29020 [Pseudomonadota bacterium]|nr:MAG: hypothetical protein Ct9H300mP28_29020 [Pseudomonadota bacterium]
MEISLLSLYSVFASRSHTLLGIDIGILRQTNTSKICLPYLQHKHGLMNLAPVFISTIILITAAVTQNPACLAVMMKLMIRW